MRYGTIQKTEANERSIRRESGRNRKTEWKRRNPRNRMIPTVSRVSIRAENTRFELHSTGFSINREKRRHAGENSVIPTVPGVVRKRMLRSFPAGTYPPEGTRREPRYAVVNNGRSRRTDGRPEFHERSQAMSGTSGSRRSWGKIRVKKVRGGRSDYAE